MELEFLPQHIAKSVQTDAWERLVPEIHRIFNLIIEAPWKQYLSHPEYSKTINFDECGSCFGEYRLRFFLQSDRIELKVRFYFNLREVCGTGAWFVAIEGANSDTSAYFGGKGDTPYSHTSYQVEGIIGATNFEFRWPIPRQVTPEEYAEHLSKLNTEEIVKVIIRTIEMGQVVAREQPKDKISDEWQKRLNVGI